VPDSRLFSHRGFVRLWFARLAGTAGSQMLMIALGWQMYELTGSAWTWVSSACSSSCLRCCWCWSRGTWSIATSARGCWRSALPVRRALPR